jgi:hypothetical protein
MGYPLLRLVWATDGPPMEGAKVRKVRVGDVIIEAEREGHGGDRRNSFRPTMIRGNRGHGSSSPPTAFAAGRAVTCRRRHSLARGAALLVSRRAATASALVSPDEHLVQTAFELHTMHGSGRGEIDQQGCDGSPVPPRSERR